MHLDISSLEKALASLGRALARSIPAPDDEELRDACIQRFEFTFELAWKMIKRRLEQDLPSAGDVDALSYRGLIRVAAERGLVKPPEAWFTYREKRNLTSHTYDQAIARDVYRHIQPFQRDCILLIGALIEAGTQDD